MNKNFIRTALFVFAVLLMNGVAQAMPDQDAQDMLTAGHFGDDDASANNNENADATSRFGATVVKKTQHQAPVAKLNPISNSSFTAESAGRSPASVGEAATRSPAGATNVGDARANTDMTIPPQALKRSINKQKAYQEVAIIANDQGFFPATLFVTQGIPVHLFVTGASKRSQCFMMDAFNVRRQIRSEKIEEIAFTPEEGGTYTFNCPMNGARGSVVVKDLDVGRIPASVNVSHSDHHQDDRTENDIKDAADNGNNFEKTP